MSVSFTTNNYPLPDVTQFTAARGKVITDADIAELPVIPAQRGCAESVILEDLAGAVGEVFAWFVYTEYDLAERKKDNQRQQVGRLAQEQNALISRRNRLEQEIKTIEGNEKRDPAELKAKQVEFLKLQIELLQNLEQQDKLIRAYDPNAAFVSPNFSELIDKATQALRELEAEQPATLEWMLAAVVKNFEGVLRRMLEQSKNIPALRQKQEEFEALRKEIETDGLDDARLLHLQTCERELAELRTAFEENKDLRQLVTERLTALITRHPILTKTLLIAAATGIGTTLGGIPCGIALKAMVENALKHMQPAEAGTKTENIVSAIFQATALYMAGNQKAAALAFGHGIFNQVAPKEAQQVVEAAAIGMVANQLGVPLSVGIGAGIGATLLARNTQVVKKIQKDLFAAKQAMRNTPFRAPLKFLKWTVIETGSYGKNVFVAARKGKKREVITRLALISLSAVAISSTAWTLPLSLGLFYLSNRVFELKYEGPASMANGDFRRYVREEVNKVPSEHRVDKLRAVLMEEDEGFREFTERLKHFIDNPVALPPKKNDPELPKPINYVDYSEGCGMI